MRVIVIECSGSPAVVYIFTLAGASNPAP